MWMLVVVIGVLVSYVVYLKRQIRHIHKQVEGYVTEQHQQPISLQLVNHELNELVNSES